MSDSHFIATVGATIVEEGGNLSGLISLVRELPRVVTTEDVTIWQGHNLVGVLLAGGVYVSLAGRRREQALDAGLAALRNARRARKEATMTTD